MSCWYLEFRHCENSHTMLIDKCYKSGLFFLPYEQVIKSLPVQAGRFISSHHTLGPLSTWWLLFSQTLDPLIVDSLQQRSPFHYYPMAISSWNLGAHCWLIFCLLAPDFVHLDVPLTAGQTPGLSLLCFPSVFQGASSSYPSPEQTRMRHMLKSEVKSLKCSQSYSLLYEAGEGMIQGSARLLYLAMSGPVNCCSHCLAVLGMY